MLLDKKYAVFAQIFATCGHKVTRGPSKPFSIMPTIELYPIVTINTSEPVIEITPGMEIQNPERREQHIVRDIWGGALFPESLIFPSNSQTLVSAGSTQPMTLQIPAQSSSVLSCLYSNWTTKSSERAWGMKNCVSP